MTVANSPVQLFIFGIFEHKWATRKHIGDLKKYSWCIPVQKEIKPIIWGAAITPEPWNRQQCWFIFEDPNVRVARLLESLATIKEVAYRWQYLCSSYHQLSNQLAPGMSSQIHDDVIKWKHIPLYWPFVRGIHRSPMNSRHKGQWRRALVFSLICVWINGWVNNREAGDLRRHRGHYDVLLGPDEI